MNRVTTFVCALAVLVLGAAESSSADVLMSMTLRRPPGVVLTSRPTMVGLPGVTALES